MCESIFEFFVWGNLSGAILLGYIKNFVEKYPEDACHRCHEAQIKGKRA